jgi:hypothetical protein
LSFVFVFLKKEEDRVAMQRIVRRWGVGEIEDVDRVLAAKNGVVCLRGLWYICHVTILAR